MFRPINGYLAVAFFFFLVYLVLKNCFFTFTSSQGREREGQIQASALAGPW